MEPYRMYVHLIRTGDGRYALQHFYESRLVWAIIKLIPRDIKKWIVVQAAVRASDGGSPDSIGYKEMYEVYAND